MSEWLARRWRLFLLGALGLLVGGVGFALLVAYSGVVNVAGSGGHPVWLERFPQNGQGPLGYRQQPAH